MKTTSNPNYNQNFLPIITVDGGAATGKGAVASALALELGFNYLDSGIYYRALAYSAIINKIKSDDEPALAKLAQVLNLLFSEGKIFWLYNNQNINITEKIRSEDCSAMSSQISHWKSVRSALLDNQRRALKPPGLVAEGRDMGSVVFPDAQVKFFLYCNVEVRAHRRLLQLENQGVYGNIDDILQGLIKRDSRDSLRECSPLKPAEGAITIDTSVLSLDEVIEKCRSVIKEVYQL